MTLLHSLGGIINQKSSGATSVRHVYVNFEQAIFLSQFKNSFSSLRGGSFVVVNKVVYEKIKGCMASSAIVLDSKEVDWEMMSCDFIHPGRKVDLVIIVDDGCDDDYIIPVFKYISNCMKAQLGTQLEPLKELIPSPPAGKGTPFPIVLGCRIPESCSSLPSLMAQGRALGKFYMIIDTSSNGEVIRGVLKANCGFG